MSPDPDFKIGGDQFNPILLRLQQNVGKGRHRIPLLHNPLDPLKARQ